MTLQKQHERVAVVGLGYVGCVTAACLAELGHAVIGVDVDPFKVERIQAGEAPFYEPGLEPLIQENIRGGRLRATTSLSDALAEANIVLICVGTPSDRNGDQSLSQLRRVAREIGSNCRERSNSDLDPLIVAVRSTVFPGTCETVVTREIGIPGVAVLSNPEFLREGTAVRDFMEPSLIVVGGDDPEALGRMASLYSPLGVPPCLVRLRTAEIIKYACNAFHALKISFANEMGSLCGALQIPAVEVMETMCADTKLNTSSAYLKPGFAFGGSCLPKDLRALTYRAGRLDLEVPLLKSVLPSNERHLQRAIDAVLDLPNEPIGIFGLAFKEDTDDLRESPAVAIIETLLGKGRQVRAFDPHVRLDGVRGANREFLLKAIPHIRRVLDTDVASFLSQVRCVVLTREPSSELRSRIKHSGLPVVSLVEPVQRVAPVDQFMAAADARNDLVGARAPA
jgi:GDP-mannose 6-dehydrogenase